MSKESALFHLETLGAADSLEERLAQAQIEATLYVGDQLARIADMIAGGFYVETGDYGTTTVNPRENR